MRFARFETDGGEGVAVTGEDDGIWFGLDQSHPDYPGTIDDLLRQERDLGEAFDLISRGVKLEASDMRFLPPLKHMPKILCIGLNYADHASETGITAPDYPTIFARFSSSVTAHRRPIRRPKQSRQLDFEGELAAVIGKAGRDIPVDRALDHVAGYSVFNDASVRDFQMRTSQWTVGKNFDGTGAFGPAFVPASLLPRGAKGLAIETRLNGQVVQQADTSDMIFDVATLVSVISEAMSLEVGDVIVTGTPSGVGAARTPPLWMKPGDLCEVEIEAVGLLANPIE